MSTQVIGAIVVGVLAVLGLYAAYRVARFALGGAAKEAAPKDLDCTSECSDDCGSSACDFPGGMANDEKTLAELQAEADELQKEVDALTSRYTVTYTVRDNSKKKKANKKAKKKVAKKAVKKAPAKKKKKSKSKGK